MGAKRPRREHGDVVQRVDEQGNRLHKYDYDAFGNEHKPAKKDPNPFRYCGEYWQEETKEYYLRARTYNPANGRFSSEDNARDGGNWYAYCGGNPVTRTDPSGFSYLDRIPEGMHPLKPLPSQTNLGGGSGNTGNPTNQSGNVNSPLNIPAPLSGAPIQPVLAPIPTTSLVPPVTIPEIASQAYQGVGDYLNPGNVYGLIISGLEAAFSAHTISELKYYSSPTALAARPSNLGKGLWAKELSRNLDDAYAVGKTAGKVFKYAAAASVAIDIGVGAYDNIQNGVSPEKIVTDAIVDAAVTGGSILLAGQYGAAIGGMVGMAVPGLGTAIGAVAGFVAGVFIYAITDMIKINGYTVREHIKNAANNLVSWIGGIFH